MATETKIKFQGAITEEVFMAMIAKTQAIRKSEASKGKWYYDPKHDGRYSVTDDIVLAELLGVCLQTVNRWYSLMDTAPVYARSAVKNVMRFFDEPSQEQTEETKTKQAVAETNKLLLALTGNDHLRNPAVWVGVPVKTIFHISLALQEMKKYAPSLGRLFQSKVGDQQILAKMEV